MTKKKEFKNLKERIILRNVSQEEPTIDYAQEILFPHSVHEVVQEYEKMFDLETAECPNCASKKLTFTSDENNQTIAIDCDGCNIIFSAWQYLKLHKERLFGVWK